jgi:hypothetical protein
MKMPYLCTANQTQQAFCTHRQAFPNALIRGAATEV